MVKDIIKASLQLSKKDKMLLVNEVLASMSSKQGRTMPVYRALETFGKELAYLAVKILYVISVSLLTESAKAVEILPYLRSGNSHYSRKLRA